MPIIQPSATPKARPTLEAILKIKTFSDTV